MEKVYEFYIHCAPDRLWAAITDSEARALFHFGLHVDCDWTVGAPMTLAQPGGPVMADGEVLVLDAPHRLVQTMRALWSPEIALEGFSRVTWDIEPVGGDACRLVLTHDELAEDASGGIYGGWPQILSGLKTYLETGTTLTTPGSLMYLPG